MNWFDNISVRTATRLADKTSRRSVLGSIGSAIAGGVLLPLLPVDRTFAQEAGDDAAEPMQDPMQCDYWAYCSVDGWLCGCCGGSTSSCPPGSKAAPITWTGTCLNPADGKSYVVAYHDCCGAFPCQRCYCNTNEGDTMRYHPQRSNSVLWCGNGGAPFGYNCTMSRILSVAE